MERLAALLRDHPGLAALLGILAVALALGAFFAVLMRRAGLSLRPLAFLGGFFGLVLGPQLLVQVADALGWIETSAWTWTPDAPAGATAADGPTLLDAAVPALALDERAVAVDSAAGGPRFRDPRLVFGPDVEPALVADARIAFGHALAGADAAQFAVFDSSQSALVARFPTPDAARGAWARSLALLGGAVPTASVGVGDAAVTVRRPSGDVARLAVVGRALFLWTAADEPALARRVAASGALRPAPSRSLAASAAGTPAPWRPGVPLLVAFLVANVAAAALWFFKGSAWAAAIAPRARTSPATEAELCARLRAAAPPDAPYAVEAGDAPGELVVTWRYADGRWLDLAGAHARRRLHRLTLRLDARSRAVRVAEEWSALDASVGRAGAAVAWRRARGITFFERRAEWTLGVPLDERGRPRRALGWGYRFDAQALKAPFVTATVDAGWAWRPLVWDAPPWLRWATE